MVYGTQAWGSAESGSGIGSELVAMENESAYLPELEPVLSGVDCVGADVVSAVVTRNNQQYARPGVAIYPCRSH
jgi:hypothetical protein